MKIGKAPGPSDTSLELIGASGGVMAEICQKVLHGFGMPAEQVGSKNSGSNLQG